jgi:hypothetical protein
MGSELTVQLSRLKRRYLNLVILSFFFFVHGRGQMDYVDTMKEGAHASI